MILWILLFIVLLSVLLYRYEIFGEGQLGYYAGEPWISFIMDGSKDIDIRLGKESSFTELVGTKIKFHCKKLNKFAEAKLIKVKHYDSLEDLASKEEFKRIAPNAKSITEFISVMKKYFTPEKIKDAGGLNALHIKLI